MGCSLLLWVPLSALPVTSLDVLIAQMCAWSVSKPPWFLVLSDFLWQSVPGSAYSLCENGSSLHFELKALHFHRFLFLHHKGWEKRDSQICHTLDGHYFTMFYHILFFVISPSLLTHCLSGTNPRFWDILSDSLGSSVQGQLCSGPLLWKRRQQPSRGAVLVYMRHRAFLCITSIQPFRVLSASLEEAEQH